MQGMKKRLLDVLILQTAMASHDSHSNSLFSDSPYQHGTSTGKQKQPTVPLLVHDVTVLSDE